VSSYCHDWRLFADWLHAEGVAKSRAALAAAVLGFQPMFYLLIGTDNPAPWAARHLLAL